MLLALQRLFVFRLLSSSSFSSLFPLSSSTLDRHSSHHSHSFATRLAAESSPRQTCALQLAEIIRKQKTSGAVDNMKCFTGRVVALATLAASVHALNGIVAPANISADTKFEVTFENANSDQYRVYLAAALAGVNGPTCKLAASLRFSCTKKSASLTKNCIGYLINSTSLKSPLSNLSIPASVGPSANYYSIAVADLTTGQGATYSNRFALSGATGNYSEYENKLGGSPFWSADDLPCTAYECARECAMDSYPDNLTEKDAFDTMKSCILDCNGVSPAPSQTAPALASGTSTSTATSEATGSATESSSSSATSDSAAHRNVIFAGAAAAGVGALAFLL